jgi:hypothetical protein
LTAPLGFPGADLATDAPAGAVPAPESVLQARLSTALDSAHSPRGARVEAVVTEPVFSQSNALILPEGTVVSGSVTVVRPARHFHRNGQLRFLIETVERPRQDAAPLRASLYSVETSADDHVLIDDEGGATVANPKSRFIAPAVALVMVSATADPGGGEGNAAAEGISAGSPLEAGSVVNRGIGGFMGLGVAGAVLSQFSRPVGIALAVAGAARTVYSNLLGKGREVTFPAGTPIELRLAPGPLSAP